MRPLRLARIAAEAERVRLRRLVSRLAMRAIFGVVALLFVFGAIVFAHVAAWYWVRTGLDQTFLAGTGILGGADLLVAIFLGFLAIRSAPSRVESEALDVRRKAVQAMASSFSLIQMAIPILRIAANIRRRRRT
jgi:hypothetical protein